MQGGTCRPRLVGAGERKLSTFACTRSEHVHVAAGCAVCAAAGWCRKTTCECSLNNVFGRFDRRKATSKVACLQTPVLCDYIGMSLSHGSRTPVACGPSPWSSMLEAAVLPTFLVVNIYSVYTGMHGDCRLICLPTISVPRHRI